MKKITIIVPIYNVEKYLKKCFDSLLCQTFEDYTILAVNDGSKDGSKEIMDAYSRQYPDKISIIHKENGGYGSVLQMAIQQIETMYFLVCDPDDTLADDALENLYAIAEKERADIVIGAKTYVYDGSEQTDYSPSYNTQFVKLMPLKVYENYTPSYDDLLFVDPSPHSKLYKTVIAKNIQFETKVAYTDNMLFYLSYLNTARVVYTDKSYSYYLIDRPGNSMSDLSSKAILGQVRVFKAILKQAQQASDMFYYRIFESYKYIVEQVKRVKCEKEQFQMMMTELYTLVQALIPYRVGILNQYKIHSQRKWIEKIKDRLLLNPYFSKCIFNDIEKSLRSKERGQ